MIWRNASKDLIKRRAIFLMAKETLAIHNIFLASPVILLVQGQAATAMRFFSASPLDLV
jgi:hypothetical protein